MVREKDGLQERQHDGKGFASKLSRRSKEASIALDAFKKLIETVDREALYKTVVAEDSGRRPGKAKYLDLDKHIRKNIRRVVDLGLHEAPPMDILDLGAGAGYFCFAARAYGHRAVALEPDKAIFGVRSAEARRRPVALGPMLDLLGVPFIVCNIRARKSLVIPFVNRQRGVTSRYDLVTAFSILFNVTPEEDGSKRHWSAFEYRFFLRDLRDNVLEPDGRVILDFNAQLFGAARPEHSAETAAYYLALGWLLEPFIVADHGDHGVELDLFRPKAWAVAKKVRLPRLAR